MFVQAYTVTSDYCETLGLKMVQGREFTAAEEAAVSGTTPVIVDVTLAERLFGSENPVGRLLQYGADSGTADSKPGDLGAATAILAIASLAASIIPARRAANVLPMTALRNE